MQMQRWMCRVIGRDMMKYERNIEMTKVVDILKIVQDRTQETGDRVHSEGH